MKTQSEITIIWSEKIIHTKTKWWWKLYRYITRQKNYRIKTLKIKNGEDIPHEHVKYFNENGYFPIPSSEWIALHQFPHPQLKNSTLLECLCDWPWLPWGWWRLFYPWNWIKIYKACTKKQPWEL